MNISIEETKIILTQLALGIFQQQSGQHQTPVSVLNPHIRQAWEYLCAVAYHNHTEIPDNFIDFVALLHTPVNEWSIIGEHYQSLSLSSSVLYEDGLTLEFRALAETVASTYNPRLQLKEQSFDLHFVPLMSQRYVAEIITEPIITENDTYSFVMKFWLMASAEDSKPILLQKTGVRRWATKKVWIKNQRSKSMYLRRSAGYLDDTPRHDVFTRVTVRNFGYRNYKYVGKQDDVFKLLPLGGSVQRDLSAFLEDPQLGQQVALMPIENRDSQDYDIGTGIESTDHRNIFNALTTMIGNHFQPLPLVSRIEQGNNLAWHDRISRKQHEQARQNALSKLPYPIRIEIHCRFQKHFRQMADEILKQLHLPSITIDQDPICITDESGNPRLDIVRIQDKHLTDTLSKQENEEDRIAYITQHYKQGPYATGIIIELPDYRRTKQKQFDPKQAIRAGLTRTGRISQFIVPEADSAKDYDHRYTNRIASLLRMLGYRHQPFYRPHHKRHVPENLDLLAFWIFQLNRGKKRKKTAYLPMVAGVPAGHHHMHLIIPSQSGRAEYYPSVPAGIQKIGSWSTDFGDSDQIIRFFHSVMEEHERPNPTLLLLVDAKLRRDVDELKSVNTNHLSFYGMLDDHPQIRVARLRFSADGDAPFCVPPIPKSKYPGLYGDLSDPHRFYSLHNVGNIHQRKNSGTLDSLNKPSYNPSTMLIHLCNLQHDDDPHEWAGLVHQLRLAHTHIDIASLLPQPIHDLDAIKKYIPDYDEPILDDDLNAIDPEED